MEFLLLGALLGLLPALIASRKGESFIIWWIYGALLFIIALPHALLKKPDLKAIEQMHVRDGMKKCPFCAEMVKPDAKVCRYCSRNLSDPAVPPVRSRV